MKDNKEFFENLRPLVNLWPAGVVLAVTMASLPGTAPVLKDIPEKLEEVAEELGNAEEVMAAEPEEVQAVGNYVDGVYTGSARGYGGNVKVQVTVENHQITAIDILSASGETTSFFKRAQGVIASVLQSQTWEVDSVSGATYSSKGILGAIQNAITGETVTNEKPASSGSSAKSTASVAFADPSSYNDGTYSGSAQGFGGTISVSVTISGGKITAVDVTEHSGETASYFSRAKAVTSRIISAQSPNVDTVSGATYSSRGIINAAKRALTQAAVNGNTDETEEEDTETTEITIPEDLFLAGNYTDGEYEGTAEGFGGDVTSRITILNNQIRNVEIISAEDETPAYFNTALAVIPEILENQTADVDTISGATYSSEGIIGSVQDALEKAKVQEETDTAGPSEEEPENPEDIDDPTEENPEDPADPADPSPNPDEEETYTPVLYNNGTYTGTAYVNPDEDEDFDPYEIKVEVTFQDDKITGVAFAGDNTFDDIKTNKTLSTKALTKLAQEAITEQSADDLDAVSGATCSSKAIKTAIQDAINQALIDSSERETIDPSAKPSDKPEEESTGEESTGEESEDSGDPETEVTDPAAAESEGEDQQAADNTNSESDSDSEKTKGSFDAKPEESAALPEAE